MKGLIDVAVRNGLSFALVIGTLSHDVNGLRRYGSNWQGNGRLFSPKTTGYSQVTLRICRRPEESSE